MNLLNRIVIAGILLSFASCGRGSSNPVQIDYQNDLLRQRLSELNSKRFYAKNESYNWLDISTDEHTLRFNITGRGGTGYFALINPVSLTCEGAGEITCTGTSGKVDYTAVLLPENKFILTIVWHWDDDRTYSWTLE